MQSDLVEVLPGSQDRFLASCISRKKFQETAESCALDSFPRSPSNPPMFPCVKCNCTLDYWNHLVDEENAQTQTLSTVTASLVGSSLSSESSVTEDNTGFGISFAFFRSLCFEAVQPPPTATDRCDRLSSC